MELEESLTPDFSYSNENSMTLAERQTCPSVEQKERPETNPHTHGQLSYDKEARNV